MTMTTTNINYSRETCFAITNSKASNRILHISGFQCRKNKSLSECVDDEC